MEDATLPELTNLSVELFGDVRFPEGSVFLYGTASYLSRVGTGIYAKEWLTVISNVERIWPGVRICPLIPLILSDCPGTLSRELSELAAWLTIVYENNPLGMQVPWAAVVAAAENLSAGATAMPHMDLQNTIAKKLIGCCPVEQYDLLFRKFTSGDLVWATQGHIV
jgi:hypothetical protein